MEYPVMKLLHIDSSILSTHSASRQLTGQIVSQWVVNHPGTTVEYLDLVVDSPNHLTSDALLQAQAAEKTPVQIMESAVTEALVSQFLAAEVIVVGAPLYNFSIPSQLKAWIDRISQRGRTFVYTESGPKGLAGGKTVIIASTRGGMYATSEQGKALEHQESYLQAIFAFVGITDVRLVRAEGLAMGDEAKAKAMSEASNSIALLAA
jgi:FMN-dependent NADH-azoreductase